MFLRKMEIERTIYTYFTNFCNLFEVEVLPYIKVPEDICMYVTRRNMLNKQGTKRNIMKLLLKNDQEPLRGGRYFQAIPGPVDHYKRRDFMHMRRIAIAIPKNFLFISLGLFLLALAGCGSTTNATTNSSVTSPNATATACAQATRPASSTKTASGTLQSI